MTTLPVLPTRPPSPLNGPCEPCVFLKVCSGLRDFNLFGCFHADCRGSEGGCDEVCPKNTNFANRVAGVRGLRFDNLAKIAQRDTELPVYIPHLNHPYSRNYSLEWPIVAVTLYDIFRMQKHIYTARAGDPGDFRSYLHLAPSTRVVVLGVDKDRPLEKYWSYRARDRAPEQLARLGIDLVIGPNFSHFIDVPRTDNLYNRKRQLLCLEEMQAAGLNVAPHLSDATEGDWDFWREYLTHNSSITFVAKEFQTGNKRRENGLAALDKLATIQQHTGRALHPILVGGSRLSEHAATLFERFTILDSRPFMNAINRHAFATKGRRPVWLSVPTLPCFGIDDLLLGNLSRYSLWITIRAGSKGHVKQSRPRKVG